MRAMEMAEDAAHEASLGNHRIATAYAEAAKAAALAELVQAIERGALKGVQAETLKAAIKEVINEP